MGDQQLQKLQKEVEVLRAQLGRSQNVMKVSEASRDLKEYATTHVRNDPIISGWQGQNIWLEPMGGRCCSVM